MASKPVKNRKLTLALSFPATPSVMADNTRLAWSLQLIKTVACRKLGCGDLVLQAQIMVKVQISLFAKPQDPSVVDFIIVWVT